MLSSTCGFKFYVVQAYYIFQKISAKNYNFITKDNAYLQYTIANIQHKLWFCQ